MTESVLVYDCEIIKAIAKKGEPRFPGIQYVSKEGPDAWRCFDEMGISVICAYDYLEKRYRVFAQDNFERFQHLCNERETIVSFNGIAFYNRLCEAHSIVVPDKKTYDILVELWVAAGLGPTFSYPSHIGFGLDACGAANNLGRKTGDGALAPVWWQKGEIGKVVDYCLQDVRLTVALYDLIMENRLINDPRNPQHTLMLDEIPF